MEFCCVFASHRHSLPPSGSPRARADLALKDRWDRLRRAPTGAIIDSRTLRSTREIRSRARYGGVKRKRGSTLHMALDTLGPILALQVQREMYVIVMGGKLASAAPAGARESVRPFYAIMATLGRPLPGHQRPKAPSFAASNWTRRREPSCIAQILAVGSSFAWSNSMQMARQGLRAQCVSPRRPPCLRFRVSQPQARGTIHVPRRINHPMCLVPAFSGAERV